MATVFTRKFKKQTNVIHFIEIALFFTLLLLVLILVTESRVSDEKR